MPARRSAARTVTLVFAIAAASLLTACGSDDQSSTAAGSSATAVEGMEGSAPAAALNAAEVAFAQDMIAHHRQAIEMAALALDTGTAAGAGVVGLATRIDAAQDPEVQLMSGWLEAAGEPVTALDGDSHDSDAHHGGSMAGMMTAEQLDELAKLAGTAFDRRWLELMIEHHQGAIVQAEAIEDAGANADVLALAAQIIFAQEAEIAEMQGLLGG